MSFAVFTDTSANLPTPIAREKDIAILPFSYYIDGVACRCLDTEAFDGSQYYGAIRRGTAVSTSLIPPGVFEEGFRPVLQEGRDVLFVSMSSGISGSFSSSLTAAEALRREFPDRMIECVDTLGASLGEGLLALEAAELRDRGMDIRQVRDRLDERKVGMCQVFTVDDLMHLRRTGRLSNAAAVIGSVLNIKPLLKGNENGCIVSFQKVRGRRRSIEAIAAAYDRLVEDAADQVIGIAHADCREDAERLIGLLRRNNPPKDIMLVDYEPVTGSPVAGRAGAVFHGKPDLPRREGPLRKENAMSDFVIYTDSACDIPPETLEQWGVPYSYLTYTFEGDERQYGNYELPYKEFYARVRAGGVARTSAVNADAFRQGFIPLLEQGKDILYIGFSTGLSSTYDAADMAARELQEKYPDRQIRCVDTRGASAGFGLLLYMAVEKKKNGGTLDECEQLVLDNRFHLCHWFTVEDLVYLKRGGRISAATAFVGNMLSFKPVLHMDDPGHLINMFKVRGRKASLEALADKYGELALDKSGGTVFISHGDCLEDADRLAGMLRDRYGVKVALIVNVGPVIGAHSGPGTLALFFLGEHR